jgi:hypothetical protein
MAEMVIDWWQKCQENGETDITKLIFRVDLNRGGTLAIAGGRIEEIGGGKSIFLVSQKEVRKFLFPAELVY